MCTTTNAKLAAGAKAIGQIGEQYTSFFKHCLSTFADLRSAQGFTTLSNSEVDYKENFQDSLTMVMGNAYAYYPGRDTAEFKEISDYSKLKMVWESFLSSPAEEASSV